MRVDDSLGIDEKHIKYLLDMITFMGLLAPCFTQPHALASSGTGFINRECSMLMAKVSKSFMTTLEGWVV